MIPRSFRLLDHPADIGVEARGENLAEAFTAAAEGLVSIFTGRAESQAGDSGASDKSDARRFLTLTSTDVDRLLVRWLSEILYLFDAERIVPGGIHISAISETSLEATILIERFDPARHPTGTEVKAVTYHGLNVHRGPGGVTLTVYFDV